MKKILFHENQLGIRGTSVSLYNYAKYNEEILGNKSIITTFPDSDLSGIEKFKTRFEINIMPFSNYEKFCITNNIDYLYLIKAGYNDNNFLTKIPSLIHCVFKYNQPHGFKYTYVSDWLAKDQGYNPKLYSVPHIIDKLPKPQYDLREKLGIADNKVVFGCFGGSSEFNIDWVHDTIEKIVNERNDIVFLFMNIDKFYEHSNIIYLPGSWILEEKSAFINACDGMIHARERGETFGCAVGEFSLENKPVITYALSSEKAHIDILSERGIYYSNPEELYNILTNLKDFIIFDDYYRPYLEYSPEKIMNKFNNIFLS
jgi:hypothetical protein